MDESDSDERSLRGETATFVAYRFEGEHHWRSVLARRTLGRVPEDRREAADDALFENAGFASLFPPGEPMTGRSRFRLIASELTGQQGRGYAV